jgi:uncharacterized protein (TIGR00730 family)
MKMDTPRSNIHMAAHEHWRPTNSTPKEPKAIRSVCVFCGSSSRVAEHYKQNAAILGQTLAQAGYRIVYGGGRVGLMGIVADSALAAGAKVIGVIPQHIQSLEVEHLGLTELHIVDSMHTRKRMMADRADAFVVLPGGFGTLDEAFEIITWKKLGLHDKPIIIFDDNHFWQPLITLMDNIVAEGFANEWDGKLYSLAKSLPEVMATLTSAQPGTHKLEGKLT